MCISRWARGSVVSELELLRISKWVKGGARLMVGSDPAGRRKIKIVRGPFGMFTRRFNCNAGDLERLQKLLQRPLRANQS
jgi:hypothetical protein